MHRQCALKSASSTIDPHTKKSYINLIDFKPEVSIGYINKVTDSKGKIILVLQMMIKQDGDITEKQVRMSERVWYNCTF
jgi:hypothetical protein